MAGGFTGKVIVGIAVSLLIFTAIIPSAIESIYSANTSTWSIDGSEDTKATTIWFLLPVVIIAGAVMKMIGIFMVGQFDYTKKK